jgi:nucleoside recognition membrane protein YjiH
MSDLTAITELLVKYISVAGLASDNTLFLWQIIQHSSNLYVSVNYIFFLAHKLPSLVRC